MESNLQHEQALETIFALLGADQDIFAEEGEGVATAGVGEPATAQGQGAEAAASGRADSGVPWVLIVDDDPDFSLALKLRLEQHGLAVVRAFDGSEGYRQAFLNPASAIILDYNMPNGRGDYTLRRLKENPVTQKIPVICATGCGSSAVARQMMALGAEVVMGKPLDAKALLNQLRKYMKLVDPVLPSPT